LIFNRQRFGANAAWTEEAMLYFAHDATEETMLYRFSCLDAHDQPVSAEEIEVRSLIDAIAKAHMMLKSRPHHETIEVWRGNSLAYRARKDRAAA
jgi:hypothetical protein